MKRFKKIFQKKDSSDDFVKESYSIVDQTIWHKYTLNPEFPYLVSFPRTGSHWLRNVMELYFEEPSLTRVFFYKNPANFTCFHIHDEELSFDKKKRIIYLYRDPVDTIFSQMNFYNENIGDKDRVKFWANRYGKHLEKWLLKDELSIDKVVLTYEGLKNDFDQEFKKLSNFLNVPYNPNKLESIHEKTSKVKIKKRVPEDPRVINSTSGYARNRDLFIEKNSELIRHTIEQIDLKLTNYF